MTGMGEMYKMWLVGVNGAEHVRLCYPWSAPKARVFPEQLELYEEWLGEPVATIAVERRPYDEDPTNIVWRREDAILS